MFLYIKRELSLLVVVVEEIVEFFDYLELKIRRVEFGYVRQDSSIQ